MAFDEGLAERCREITRERFGFGERKMFGGLAFMVDGNMAFGIIGDDLMVRVGPEAHADALEMPHAREMDFTGRSMKGFVYVGSEGLAEDEDLEEWIEMGEIYARTFPPK